MNTKEIEKEKSTAIGLIVLSFMFIYFCIFKISGGIWILYPRWKLFLFACVVEITVLLQGTIVKSVCILTKGRFISFLFIYVATLGCVLFEKMCVCGVYILLYILIENLSAFLYSVKKQESGWGLNMAIDVLLSFAYLVLRGKSLSDGEYSIGSCLLIFSMATISYLMIMTDLESKLPKSMRLVDDDDNL